MIKSVDYSFPQVSDAAACLFPKEVNKLSQIWVTCCSHFEQNAHDETEYKDSTAYRLLENRQPAMAGSVTGITVGGGCLAWSIQALFATAKTFAAPLCCIGGCALMLPGIWVWKNIVDANHEMKNFIDFRIESHRTIEKIEGCIKLMNQIGEFYNAFELAKESTTDESLFQLFKSFKHVQKAELGVLSDSIDPVLPFFVMDNICKEMTTDLKIMDDWKVYFDATTSHPPEFKYFKATKQALFQYMIRREGNHPLQVDAAISRLKTHIEKIFD